jgi:hypothetical protein
MTDDRITDHDDHHDRSGDRSDDRIARALGFQTEGEVTDWACTWLRKHGYRQPVKLPPPRRELPGQVRIMDFDPVTGELRSERFVQQRDGDGRPI